jgi:hypothetical protein
MVAVSCLFAAEISYVAVLRGHFAAGMGTGAAYAAVGVAPGGLGAALLLRMTRSVYRLTAGIGALLVAAWLVGSPFGGGMAHAEAVRGIDTEPAVLIAAALLAVCPLLARPRLQPAARRGRGRGGSIVAGCVIVVLVTSAAQVANRPSAGRAHPATTHAPHSH